MAKQESIIKFTGNIGDLSFFKTKDGYSARKKTGVSGDRIKKDPRFARTRENIEEFGRAASASKLSRNGLRRLMRTSKDSRVTPRLTGAFLSVIKTDSVNRRGKRKVVAGNLELLRGFEFNVASPLNRVFAVMREEEILREEARAEVRLPSFVPSEEIEWPEGSTHCKLLCAAIEVDFDNARFVLSNFEGDAIDRAGAAVPESVITLDLPENSELPIFLLLGIDFLQFSNGEMYPLKNGTYNSLSLIGISGS
jgi:hypothetical protein